MLPNFLIIGAPRAGTSSLYEYLKQHPEVFMSPTKELFFFDDPSKSVWTPRELAAYEQHFAGVSTETAIGEATPTYLYSSKAATEICEVIPDVRILVLLRQPADRAFSAYVHGLRSGDELRRIEHAFDADALHVRGGFYYPFLRRYFELLAPERIHVVLLDDLTSDPAAVCASVFGFLGVDPAYRPDELQQHSRSRPVQRFPIIARILRKSAPRRRLYSAVPLALRDRVKARLLTPPPQFPPELRERLTEMYRHDIQRTSDLIGRDLSHWLEQARPTDR